MPDAILCSVLPYSIYFFVFFWVFATIRMHSTVGENVVGERDERDGMKGRRVWNQSSR
jgi:hypothetical protein